MAERSKACVYGRSLAGIAGSNPAGGMDGCPLCVLSGRGLCDRLITRPKESCRLWCVLVCDFGTSRRRATQTRKKKKKKKKNLLHLSHPQDSAPGDFHLFWPLKTFCVDVNSDRLRKSSWPPMTGWYSKQRTSLEEVMRSSNAVDMKNVVGTTMTTDVIVLYLFVQ